MPIPDLTHLQYLVLEELEDGERSGRDLRQKLEEYGVRKSSPAFYQLMARLEKADYVRGKYVPRFVGDQNLRERTYTVTPTGIATLASVREFYASRIPNRLGYA